MHLNCTLTADVVTHLVAGCSPTPGNCKPQNKIRGWQFAVDRDVCELWFMKHSSYNAVEYRVVLDESQV